MDPIELKTESKEEQSQNVNKNLVDLKKDRNCFACLLLFEKIATNINTEAVICNNELSDVPSSVFASDGYLYDYTALLGQK